MTVHSWLATDADGYEVRLAVTATSVEYGRCAHRPGDEVPGLESPLDHALDESWLTRVRVDFGATVLDEYRAAVVAFRASRR